MTSLMPPEDEEFDRGPKKPASGGEPAYGPDFARAEQDRGSYGLASVAYWIARAAQKLAELVRRN